MKILILQLARLGDIYMSWPAMRALRRKFPEAEIHLLTRPRFEAAVEGLQAVNYHWSLPSSHILSPLVQEEADLEKALARIDETVTDLKKHNFDQIINFTFSPFSSYLTHALTGEDTQVVGYTRHHDGTFAFADEVSAYFYAQVGIEKSNRVHLADIFASMVDVQYIEEDWAAPFIPNRDLSLPENYVAVHIGASENHKSLSPTQWGDTLKYMAEQMPQMQFVLIGAGSEKDQAAWIRTLVPESHIVDLVGQTQISDLFQVLQKAQLLIGGDSAPMHMASLTDTPSLNVSVGNVNFWETGPKASLSFILRANTEADVHSDRLGEIAVQLLQGKLSEELIIRAPGMTSYECQETAQDRFQWDLIQAIYMNGAYPLADRMELIQGAMKLDEINTFASEQLAQVPRKGVAAVAPYLERAEEIIESISRIVPELNPLINWYHAEKVRIGPASQEDVLAATLSVHQALGKHLRVYIPHENLMEEGVGDGTL
ncbi:Lipopolysaccharide core heptosyltransferase RfaQ [compost metagenome]